jgi:hypothetical protein
VTQYGPHGAERARKRGDGARHKTGSPPPATLRHCLVTACTGRRKRVDPVCDCARPACPRIAIAVKGEKRRLKSLVDLGFSPPGA